MEPILGQLMIFAGNYAPRDWMFCNGQLLSIQQYTALYALLGTQYGGDGIQTFALPDLRGRTPIHFGTGPGLSSYDIGEAGGNETVTLLSSQMPMHTHTVNPNYSMTPSTSNPSNGYPANVGQPVYGTVPNGNMGGANVAPAGSSMPHENMQPYLVMNYCICVEGGMFPARN